MFIVLRFETKNTIKRMDRKILNFNHRMFVSIACIKESQTSAHIKHKIWAIFSN